MPKLMQMGGSATHGGGMGMGCSRGNNEYRYPWGNEALNSGTAKANTWEGALS